jgi:hypothetical protein
MTQKDQKAKIALTPEPERVPSVRIRIACMLTAKGVPCVETALCEHHDTPENRTPLERETLEVSLDGGGVRWVADGGEELLTCMICGVRSDGSEDEGPFDE